MKPSRVELILSSHSVPWQLLGGMVVERRRRRRVPAPQLADSRRCFLDHHVRSPQSGREPIVVISSAGPQLTQLIAGQRSFRHGHPLGWYDLPGRPAAQQWHHWLRHQRAGYPDDIAVIHCHRGLADHLQCRSRGAGRSWTADHGYCSAVVGDHHRTFRQRDHAGIQQLYRLRHGHRHCCHQRYGYPLRKLHCIQHDHAKCNRIVD